jgi:hypothetical protein
MLEKDYVRRHNGLVCASERKRTFSSLISTAKESGFDIDSNLSGEDMRILSMSGKEVSENNDVEFERIKGIRE